LGAIVIFLLLNLIWITILYLSLGVFYKRKNLNLLYVFFFVFGILAVVISFVLVIDYTETTGFCSDVCHPMEDYGESFTDAEEGTILATHRDEEVNCADCHNQPGVVGIMKSKYAGVVEVYKFATGSYEEPLHNPEIDEGFCAKNGCHVNTDWKIQGLVNETSPDGEIDHPEEYIEICNDCHAPHQEGIKLKPLACTVCHEDISEEDLFDHEEFVITDDRFLEIMENVTDADTCGDCHENMDKLPYKSTTPNEFCQGCHNDEFVAYSENFSVNQIDEYGGCANCHTDHKEVEELHPVLDEIDCEDCHNPNNEEEFNIHNPSNIKYGAVKDALSSDFCADCHEGEVEAFEENVSPGQLEYYGKSCVSCHSDHDVINDPHPILENVDCGNCHTNYDDEITAHNPSEIRYASETSRIDNDFCSGCHNAEFNAYTGNVTEGQAEVYGENCINCHTDHDVVPEIHTTPDDLNCVNCHTDYDDGITTHDPSKISYQSVGSFLNSDFCQDCHEKEYTDYEKQLGSYGSCVNCHGDHDEKTLPHPTVEERDCSDCHENIGEDIHDPTNTNYGDLQLENEFCSQCHDVQYENVENGTLAGYECVECHGDHTVTVSEERNCGNCHTNFKINHSP